MATFLLLNAISLLAQNEPDNFIIKGAVREAKGGTGLARADVTVSGRGNKVDVQTDEHGRYSLSGLKSGDYIVYCHKEGYGGRISRIRNVHLGPEAHEADVDFRLPQESVVSGRVFDIDKKPVVGVRVHILKAVFHDGLRTLTPRGESLTGEDGRYRFSSLDEGEYFVDVDAKRPEVETVSDDSEKKHIDAAMNPVHTFYPHSTSADGAAAISLRAGEEQREINVRLSLAPTHCVGAKSAYSAPASVALWMPLPGAFRVLTGGEVAAGAKFRICGLGEDIYKLTFGTFDSAGGTVAMATAHFTIGRKDVDLGAIAPLAGTRLSGRVLVSGAQPGERVPEGVVVSLSPTDEIRFINEILDATVADTGLFEISNLLSGAEYWVSVYGLPQGYYLKSATLGARDARRTAVVPNEGQLEVLLAKDGASIKGIVTDSDGKPVADVDVAIVPKNFPPVGYPGLIRSTSTDQNGRVQFRGIEPGEYKLLAVPDLAEGEIENPNVLRRLLSSGKDVAATANGVSNLTIAALEGHFH